jgi:hypothetical protein
MTSERLVRAEAIAMADARRMAAALGTQAHDEGHARVRTAVRAARPQPPERSAAPATRGLGLASTGSLTSKSPTPHAAIDDDSIFDLRGPPVVSGDPQLSAASSPPSLAFVLPRLC